MKRIVSFLAVAILALAPAWAHAQAKATDKPAKKGELTVPAAPAEKPAAAAEKPAAKPEAAPAAEAARPASVSIAPAPEKVAAADKPRRPSRSHEDARACLEQPTNREVAICAEKYR